MLKIVEGILKGDRRSLSRAISIIDNEEGEYQEIALESERLSPFKIPLTIFSKYVYPKI